MTTQVPRVVLITRASAYQELLRRHGTHEQGRFFLETRGLSIEPLVERHQRLETALVAVQQAVPKKWRQARVDRADLDRFVFEPEDLVVAIGQDGLVANCAKYLTGQSAKWYEGDWNRDGVFDQNDVIMALAARTYLAPS